MVSEVLPLTESLGVFAKNLKSNKTTSICTGSFIPKNAMNGNTKNLSEYLNMSDMTTDPQNVSNQSIQLGTELFLYLNLCPKSTNSFVDYWTTLYENLFVDSLSSQQIVLTLLKIIKNRRSKDGQDMANIILARLSKELGFRYFIPELTRKGIFGENVYWKSINIRNITGTDTLVSSS